jgi:hypothetical protein
MRTRQAVAENRCQGGSVRLEEPDEGLPQLGIPDASGSLRKTSRVLAMLLNLAPGLLHKLEERIEPPSSLSDLTRRGSRQ